MQRTVSSGRRRMTSPSMFRPLKFRSLRSLTNSLLAESSRSLSSPSFLKKSFLLSPSTRPACFLQRVSSLPNRRASTRSGLKKPSRSQQPTIHSSGPSVRETFSPLLMSLASPLHFAGTHGGFFIDFVLTCILASSGFRPLGSTPSGYGG